MFRRLPPGNLSGLAEPSARLFLPTITPYRVIRVSPPCVQNELDMILTPWRASAPPDPVVLARRCAPTRTPSLGRLVAFAPHGVHLRPLHLPPNFLPRHDAPPVRTGTLPAPVNLVRLLPIAPNCVHLRPLRHRAHFGLPLFHRPSWIGTHSTPRRRGGARRRPRNEGAQRGQEVL